MGAARNEGAKEDAFKTTAPRTPPQASRGTACRPHSSADGSHFPSRQSRSRKRRSRRLTVRTKSATVSGESRPVGTAEPRKYDLGRSLDSSPNFNGFNPWGRPIRRIRVGFSLSPVLKCSRKQKMTVTNARRSRSVRDGYLLNCVGSDHALTHASGVGGAEHPPLHGVSLGKSSP